MWKSAFTLLLGEWLKSRESRYLGTGYCSFLYVLDGCAVSGLLWLLGACSSIHLRRKQTVT